MGRALVRNNAYSAVAATLLSTATSLTVTAGTGSRFPNLVSGSGDYFYITLIDTSNNVEVVKVTAVAGDVFTIQRGQDGTAARAFALSDRVELRPTAALFDDKVPFGGGTFTGHIEVPAGASGAQVPRADAVLSLGGGVLTGTLFVPTLSAVDGEIELPTSQRIKSPDVGGLVAPGMVIQTKYIRADVQDAYAAAGSGGQAEITALTTTFTPRFSNSDIVLQYSVTGESTDHDITFRLTRNGISIGNNETVPGYWNGWMPSFYDGDATTTPQNRHMMYVDTPGTATEITYRIFINTSSTGATTFYLNRSVSGPSADDETGISQLLIQEIAR